MPPDMRRGSASPVRLRLEKGTALGSGFALMLLARGRTKGTALKVCGLETARHSLASHPAAEPQRIGSSFMMALDFQGGISHPAAEPQRIGSSFMMALDFQDGISHPAA